MALREYLIDPKFGDKRLAEATVQEIQLELFRRSVAAEFDVNRFISVLLANRRLWSGAVIDRLGINDPDRFPLSPMSMIKLRDIHQNVWNADTLYVLCPSRAAADDLVAKLPMEEFACMPEIVSDKEDLGSAMGTRAFDEVIIRFWWD
jgi:hypothetical protein